jgi:rRNA maturation endonuclease Nob1
MKRKKEKKIHGFTYKQIEGAMKLYKMPPVDICELCGGREEGLCNKECPEYKRRYNTGREVK